MALLESHLEQIELCSATILELPFPPPGIFTNALLSLPDITALIRDPDAHESALFTVVPAADFTVPRTSNNEAGRRSTFFEPNDNGASRAIQPPRRNTAVAAVLGGDMAERLRRERMGEGQGSRRRTGMPKEDIDIELLLKGAEKLCKVYPMSGALERIAALRSKHGRIAASIERYEGLVAKQTAQLKGMNRFADFADQDPSNDDFEVGETSRQDRPTFTQEDLRRDEDGVKELERRKRTLEERVSGMKKDLGGILR